MIRLSGYTELEKLEICKRFLVKKQIEATGLAAKDIEFADEGLQTLIQSYTREAGVRNLEREVGNVCRKIARKVVGATGKKVAKAQVNAAKVQELLGPLKFRDLQTSKKNETGATTGLAWTEVGGQILTTEATIMGRGKLTTTGKLGDVMQESAQAAMSYIRSACAFAGPGSRFLPEPRYPLARAGRRDPKDRLSAGITIATSIELAARHSSPGRPGHDRRDPLRGKVPPIGGMKEKLLAAHRHGIPPRQSCPRTMRRTCRTFRRIFARR